MDLTEHIENYEAYCHRLTDDLKMACRLSIIADHHELVRLEEGEYGRLRITTRGRTLPEHLRVRINRGDLLVKEAEQTMSDGQCMVEHTLEVRE